MPPKAKIHLAFYLSQLGVFRDIALGIYDYADRNRFISTEGVYREFVALDRLPEFNFNALITNLTGNQGRILEMFPNIPKINVSGVATRSPIPVVKANSYSIGQIAADHLLGCGFASFATAGRPTHAHSHLRLRGFVDAIQKSGAPCLVFEEELFKAPLEEATALSGDVQRWTRSIEIWIRNLPKPVGIFAHDDIIAKHISRICMEQGWDVPRQVGILGCDNDPMICCSTFPQLSSVIYPGRSVGMQATALVERIHAGEPVPADTVIEIPPPGVQSRGSTDMAFNEGDRASKAIVFLRSNLEKEISVEDLARVAGMSRRSFERHFRRTYWMTPLELIRQERIRKARELLYQTNLPMSHVAELSGFLSSQRMSVVFKDLVGMTPSDFRSHYH